MLALDMRFSMSIEKEFFRCPVMLMPVVKAHHCTRVRVIENLTAQIGLVVFPRNIEL